MYIYTYIDISLLDQCCKNIFPHLVSYLLIIDPFQLDEVLFV